MHQFRSARRKPHNYRTLASLLDSQPAGLVKDPRHRYLWDLFKSSQVLKRLRISPRCYSILNKASVKAENLHIFYRIYNLPPDPFFPLFLAVKAEWLEQRRMWREKRDAEIFSRMKDLPDHYRRALRILAEYERMHHPKSDNPVWENRLFPKTKSQAEKMIRFTEEQWYRLWREHLLRLSERYRSIPRLVDEEKQPTYSMRILAVLILRCRDINRKEIARNYRRLSKLHHPDYGGNPESFLRLKIARDILLDEFKVGHRITNM